MRNVVVTFRNRKDHSRFIISVESNNIPMGVAKARLRLVYLTEMRSCDWFDFEVEAAHFTDETPREATIAEIDHKIRTGKVVSVSEINTWVHSSTGRVALAALREVA